jgi:uncharacterized protein YfiM (DUF2279 family)
MGRPAAVAAFVLLVAPTARAADPDPWFGEDKAKHFAATWALATGGYAGAAFVTDVREWRLVSGAALGMGAGFAKELWDLAGNGNPSWRDLAWDGIGTATGLLTSYAFDRVWEAWTRPEPLPEHG